MNLKKFISGVSAFAIAASAFAGLAVTVNANYSHTGNVYTWDFADYDSESSDYAVFGKAGSASISTEGIAFPSSNGAAIGSNYATFTAPVTGTVTMTITNTYSNKFTNNYIYADAAGTNTLASAWVPYANYTNSKTGVTYDGTGTMSTTVTEGTTYYLYSNGSSGTACAKITNVSLVENVATVYAKADLDNDGTAETTINTYRKTVTDDKVTVYYNKYIEYGGVYYTVAQNSNPPYYGKSLTAGETADVTYTATEYTWAGEETDVEFSRYSSGGLADRLSGGEGYRIYGNTSGTNNDNGEIRLTGWHSTVDNTVVELHVTGRNNSTTGQSYPIYYKVGDTYTDTGKKITFENDEAYTHEHTATVTVPANATIVIYHHQTYSSNVWFDCFALKATVNPTAVAAVVDGNVNADDDYEGDDKGDVYSVFSAVVTAGTSAIKSVSFKLTDTSNGIKSTPEYKEGIIVSGHAIFGLVAPMASTDISNIKAVIDGKEYTAYTVE